MSVISINTPIATSGLVLDQITGHGNLAELTRNMSGHGDGDDAGEGDVCSPQMS